MEGDENKDRDHIYHAILAAWTTPGEISTTPYSNSPKIRVIGSTVN